MSTYTNEELKTKYPDSHYAPDPNCKYCNGTGEKKIHIAKSEFNEEKDIISPCICIFVEHEFAIKIAPVLGNWAHEQLIGLKRGKQ